MTITVDPAQPILWVRASGLSGFRGVTIYEIRPGTIADPTPDLFELISLHASMNGVVRPLLLPRDAAGAHLLSAGLQVNAGFDPSGNTSEIVVEFFTPEVGLALPPPVATLRFPFSATFFASEDVGIAEAP